MVHRHLAPMLMLTPRVDNINVLIFFNKRRILYELPTLNTSTRVTPYHPETQFLSIPFKSLSLRYSPLPKHGVQMCVYPLISSDNGRLILGIKRPVSDADYIRRNTSSLKLIAN